VILEEGVDNGAAVRHRVDVDKGVGESIEERR